MRDSSQLLWYGNTSGATNSCKIRSIISRKAEKEEAEEEDFMFDTEDHDEVWTVKTPKKNISAVSIFSGISMFDLVWPPRLSHNY